MTAVMRRADAVLQALMIMSSSISPSLSSSPGLVVCRMNTSSSRTDSRITTEVSWLEYLKTVMSRRSTPSLRGVSVGGVGGGARWGGGEEGEEDEEEGRDLSATFFASSGCEFPVSSLIEFEVIAGPYQCEGGVEGDISSS